MPSFLRRFLDRLSDRVDRSARGTPVPAGTEPAAPGERSKPTARERTLMRRRLRTLRRRREALMLEVGGEVLESRRGDGSRLDGKTAELEQVDSEARVLAEALDELKTLDEVIASGVAGRCPNCGELVAARDSYCSACGTSLKPGRPSAAEPAGAQRAPARVGGARSGATTTAAATGHGPSGGSAPPPAA